MIIASQDVNQCWSSLCASKEIFRQVQRVKHISEEAMGKRREPECVLELPTISYFSSAELTPGRVNSLDLQVVLFSHSYLAQKCGIGRKRTNTSGTAEPPIYLCRKQMGHGRLRLDLASLRSRKIS